MTQSPLEQLSHTLCSHVSVPASRSHDGAPRKFCFHVFSAGAFLQHVCQHALFKNGSVSNNCVSLCLCKTAPSKGIMQYRRLPFFCSYSFLLCFITQFCFKDAYFSLTANTFGSLKLDILYRSVEFFLSHKESTTSKHNCRLQQSTFEILRDICLAVWVTLEYGTPPVGLPRAVFLLRLTSLPSLRSCGRCCWGVSPTSRVRFARSNSDIAVTPAYVIGKRNFGSGRSAWCSNRCPPSSSEN